MLPPILQQIPFSTLFILSLAASVSLVTSLARRLLTDPEETKAWRKEISGWSKELREAQKEGDQKRVKKLQKKQQQVMQLQSKMMWQSMKVGLLFIVPLFVIWHFLRGFFTDPIAFFPGVGHVIPFLNLGSLFWWYMLCSFLFGTIFSHLFGLIDVE